MRQSTTQNAGITGATVAGSPRERAAMKHSLAAGRCVGVATVVLTASTAAASVDWPSYNRTLTTGMTSPIWPTAKVTAKVMVLGLK